MSGVYLKNQVCATKIKMSKVYPRPELITYKKGKSDQNWLWLFNTAIFELLVPYTLLFH